VYLHHRPVTGGQCQSTPRDFGAAGGLPFLKGERGQRRFRRPTFIVSGGASRTRTADLWIMIPSL
jgi:hypothetical protein